MTDSAALRILDASLNRAAEGLRVAEDYVRFVLDDRHLTEQFKRLRHDLAAAGRTLPLALRHAARDVQGDVGATVSTPSEARRGDAWEVCVASLERAKQSLRSLEEYAKVAAPVAAAEFERLRYQLYSLEAATGRTVDAVMRLAEARLYVLVDGCESQEAFAALINELIAVPVDAIQLRDKTLNDHELLARARLLRELTLSPPAEPSAECYSPLMIINDRPDIATLADADGVHLGQDDLRVKDARAIMGPRKLIGVSTHSIEQARTAALDGANYIGVGPTFPTSTKSFDAFPGLELVRQVAAEIRLPAFAIGGIAVSNIGEVLALGLERVAVASAVTTAASPHAAARELRERLRSAR